MISKNIMFKLLFLVALPLAIPVLFGSNSSAYPFPEDEAYCHDDAVSYINRKHPYHYKNPLYPYASTYAKRFNYCLRNIQSLKEEDRRIEERLERSVEEGRRKRAEYDARQRRIQEEKDARIQNMVDNAEDLFR